MKTKVRVTLAAEVDVEIEVEHEEGDDPTDLTKEDEQRALRDAPSWPDWTIDDVDIA